MRKNAAELKLREHVRTISLEMIELQNRLYKLELVNTAHAANAVLQALGFEAAEKLEKFEKTPKLKLGIQPGDMVVRSTHRKSGGWFWADKPFRVSHTKVLPDSIYPEIKLDGLPVEWWPSQWFKRVPAPATKRKQ